MTPAPAIKYSLPLTEEEREALLQLLERSLEDVRVERRRTEAPEYHELVRHEEAVLAAMAEKVRGLAR